jgi:hypothetical protein
MDAKPRKVKAKITRVVTEIAIVYLNRDGSVDEYEECHEELDSEVTELHEIRTVLSVHP